jgi:multiple sugar transport system ATP-binding protein
MSQIQVRNLSKHFAEKTAVNDLSFEVGEGEFLAVVGPSGCGKTTTLRMLAGLESASSGEIRLGDRVVNEIRPRDRNVGMVFQDYAIFPHLTVYDNIAYGLVSRGTSRPVIRERVDKAAKAFRIDDLLRRKPKQLSGGQRQRVALARAMVRDADYYLYDEPLSNLDAQLRLSAREDILQLHREKGKPSLYVTHDQSEAMALADRIAVMRGGELMQIGTGTELYDNPQHLFVAFFIGTPSMNLFEATLTSVADKLYAVTPWFKLALSQEQAQKLSSYRNKTVKLGIRPEALYPPKLASFEVSEDNTLEGLVNVIEPATTGCIVYLTSPEDKPTDFIATLKAKLPSKYIGQSIPLAVDLSKLHLFDPVTEKSLLYA